MLQLFSCFAEILLALGCGKNINVMSLGSTVVTQAFNNHCRFLLIDETRCFRNEMLWVLLELRKNVCTNAA